MMLNVIRNFATKRTIPYVTKGKWKLPTTINAENESPIAGDSWGVRQSLGVNVPKDWRELRHLPQWKRQMFALKEKFQDGWNPRRKLSREQMERLRDIKASQPQINNTALGEMFKVSPESIRRILKSRWKPSTTEKKKLQERWTRRGERLGAKGNRAPGVRLKPTQASKRLKDPGQNIF